MHGLQRMQSDGLRMEQTLGEGKTPEGGNKGQLVA